jgi:hypothetical protein
LTSALRELLARRCELGDLMLKRKATRCVARMADARRQHDWAAVEIQAEKLRAIFSRSRAPVWPVR